MRFLLDTMVVSEPGKPRPNHGALEWLEAHAFVEMAVSVLTLGEISRGVARMAAGKRKQALQDWLAHDLPAQFEGRVLTLDVEVALKWGELTAEGDRTGRALPTIDGLLLATAQVHGLTLVTRNVGHFAERGVSLLNPYA